MSIRTTTSLWRFVVQGHVVTASGVSRKCFNVFHFESAGGAVDNPGAKPNIFAFWNVGRWKSIATRLHVDYVPDGIYMWKMTDPTDSLTLAGIQLGGGSGGNRLPTHQTVFGYNGGGLRGASWHGSKRYAPITQLDVVKDELTAVAHGRWNTAHQAVNNAFSFFIGGVVFSAVPVIYSRRLSGPDPTVGPNWICDLTTTYCDTTLSSWRHRREPVQR